MECHDRRVSNVGSTDVFINVLKAFEETLHSRLETCATFPEFLEACKDRLRAVIADAVAIVNKGREAKARCVPQLVRSLFVDDCIDVLREYNEGGARYSWGTAGIVGLNNLIDSLAAIKIIVFGPAQCSPHELLAILKVNFGDQEPFRRQLLALPKFGNDQPEVNALAHELSRFIFLELKQYAYWAVESFCRRSSTS